MRIEGSETNRTNRVRRTENGYYGFSGKLPQVFEHLV